MEFQQVLLVTPSCSRTMCCVCVFAFESRTASCDAKKQIVALQLRSDANFGSDSFQLPMTNESSIRSPRANVLRSNVLVSIVIV